MRDLLQTLKEILEYIWKDRKYWLIPTILALIILWLLLTTSSTTPVPVFIYPMA